MNKIFAATLAAALLLPGTAYAQNNRPETSNTHRVDPKADSKTGAQSQQPAHGQQVSTSAKQNSAPQPKANSQGKATQHHKYSKGDRFSRSQAVNYRRVSYRENKQLKAPPAGYVWVRSGNDALLVRLRNNLIVQVVYDIF